ncbi:fructosamine kinase family protein [Marinicella sp. S1101]|uniref:fructosamine kinase family protein n=1 Tax=Marinicella marina TaxID=2996016 RepID=UPI002260E065|nr:fructosamine kinase family protein [Marinicella marina]MCX7552819.1 fructosamine kinase family protein [Marinicella marina]MDJ1139872.1 fructosamine kinase family protein [Marinicella marina]
MTFTKHNNTTFDDALIKEANGLALLKNELKKHNIKLKIPQVLQVNEQALTLQKIQQSTAAPSQWYQLGQALAQLHLIQQPHHGHNEDNYIGLSPQPNEICDNWGQFFCQHRLLFQIQRIQSSSKRTVFLHEYNSTSAQLAQFLNENCDYPSLLHGDLWAGNVLFDYSNVWLIDPAVYCGDADADLAMTELFGGLAPAFYDAYFATKPKSKNYAVKRTIFNLYHQLNHYNLFGSSYWQSCQQGLLQISKQFS